MTASLEPKTVTDLIGSYRSFGTEGPVYQVTRPVNGAKVHILVVQTGEELDYPIEQAQRDPVAK
jgi:hypothetical protein